MLAAAAPGQGQGVGRALYERLGFTLAREREGVRDGDGPDEAVRLHCMLRCPRPRGVGLADVLPVR